MSSILKDKLKRDNIWEDFLQELHVSGYLAWQQEMSMEETRRYAQRQIHAFFKEYGYRRYRNSYIKLEQCFSAVFADWQERNLSEMECSVEVWPDSAGDNYLKEHILSILKRKPEGMTRAELTSYLEVSVKELQGHLDSLIREKRIVQVDREGYGGFPPTPLLFIAGARIPEQKSVRTEIFTEIRRLYFEERKTTKQIAQERHHSLRTIGKAIHFAPNPVVNNPERELMRV
jgi:hypothetical protein